MNKAQVTRIIQELDLQKHPEGGYYREIYRSTAQTINKNGAERSLSTSIYYLLEGHDFSAFHRIQSDEIWHFYRGTPLEIVEINKNHEILFHALSNDLSIGKPQIVIEAGSWFAAHLPKKTDYALVGCGVAPGFDFRDFEMASRENLLQEYPQYRQEILTFTRK